ncbi:hypothetical protein GQ55_2G317500 [Panicum hallii var. hallii]|uniref:Uncharacterized protein n=1 Tax=Panicum hallii var. hallii TaxID=1504633 RepID=A0A2T7EUJ1_9POAL|nr:hypothetical protein GQ55_2G317500 [Panicum hallii var. hallii]
MPLKPTTSHLISIRSSLAYKLMPSLRHSSSLVNLLDKQLHQLPTSKMMKISKSAPNLLKKAVTSFKCKTDALRTKLIILASLRRRMAMVRAVSRQIHALTASGGRDNKQAAVEHGGKAFAPRKAAAAAGKEAAGDHGGEARRLGLFEVAVFEEDYHGGYPDWTTSLFNDDNIYNDEEEDVVQDDEQDDLDLDAFDETSVIEILRSNREAQGLEFCMEDDIDEACDMFIRRCRSRMNLSF